MAGDPTDKNNAAETSGVKDKERKCKGSPSKDRKPRQRSRERNRSKSAERFEWCIAGSGCMRTSSQNHFNLLVEVSRYSLRYGLEKLSTILSSEQDLVSDSIFPLYVKGVQWVSKNVYHKLVIYLCIWPFLPLQRSPSEGQGERKGARPGQEQREGSQGPRQGRSPQRQRLQQEIQVCRLESDWCFSHRVTIRCRLEPKIKVS